MEQNVNQNVNQTPQEQPEVQMPTGWARVLISEELPLKAIIQFLNVINQRLCGLEDNTYITGPDGKHINLTELYELQAKAEQEAQMKAQQEAQAQTEEKKEDK